jgi:hypothetical protein
MGVPTSEVGYTSATTGRGDQEVHKGHVVALGKTFIENKISPTLAYISDTVRLMVIFWWDVTYCTVSFMEERAASKFRVFTIFSQ